jgi:(S)-sulfolactate dehydrogenase
VSEASQEAPKTLPDSAKPLVVVSEFLPAKNLSDLEARVDVIYDPDLYSDRARLLERVGECRAVIVRNRTQVDSELMAAAPRMEVVGRLGVGLDNIDMDAASRAGVEVIPATGANAVSVAEYVMGAMLVLQRGVFSMTEAMVAGVWPRQGHAFGRELMGKVLGLIGYGMIAREVARRASGFGMRVIAHDPYLRRDDAAWSETESVGLDHLLAVSDVVSVHVPRTEGTVGLIDDRALSLMKPSALIIDTARGGVVDETALADALRSGALGGAALDVFESEPLLPESAVKFSGLGNLVLTPHLAGNTAESVDRVAGVTVDAVLDRLLSGSSF